MNLDDPLKKLKGIGETLGKKFASLGLKTVADLIDYYPRRYEDYSALSAISKLRPGPVSIEAKIQHVSGRRVRGGLHITEAIASDSSGSVRLIWFNQPYRANSFKDEQSYFISGEYQLSHQRFQIMNPAIEMASSFPANTARILAIYRETKGLTSRQIRLAIRQLVPMIRDQAETLPAWIIKGQKLMSRAEALEELHFPTSTGVLATARRRLAFEEVFSLSLASLLNKQENQGETAPPIAFKKKLAQDFVVELPFKLTDDQRRTIWQIYLDIQASQPMNRLVEGDVGAGKTVVAAMAALMALAQKHQVAFMAPTELLARQHAETIHKLFSPLGYESQVVLLVGSMSTKQKSAAHQSIAAGKASFIVGTQALLQEKVDMKNLVLIIIDEQHRFGVEQRQTLMIKAGHMPHVLSLTATPIPRSLALTLYGELDISLLKQKPAGRQLIATEIVPLSSRASVYQDVDKQIQSGRQVFVVCPAISESMLDLQTVEQVYKQLKEVDFKHRRVGLLHGKLKALDKQKVMEEFIDAKLDILVSTTVIEVGVDVPNAAVMMIRSPERFGLAQLHQLRGRVGRSTHQGFCYLLLEDNDPPTRRLRALVSSNDGFKLAELDLDLRGPGAIYGTTQHGALDLRIAKLSDTSLIAAASSAAKKFMEKENSLLKYPQLSERIKLLRAVTNLN